MPAPSLRSGLAALLVLVVITAALLRWGWPASPPPPAAPPVARVTVDRVHDLVTLLDRAEVGHGSIYRRLGQPQVDPDDPRDRLVYLRADPGSTLTFRGLFTSGPARLTFACGVGHTGDGVPSVPVRFTIEACDVPARSPGGPRHGSGRDTPPEGGAAGDGCWERVFERVLAPADLAPERRAEPFALLLPGDGPTHRSLRFGVELAERAPRDGPPIRWPAWIEPQLRSDGRTVPLSAYPVHAVTIAADLVARRGEAEVLLEDPEQPIVRAALNPAPGTSLAGGRRSTLRMVPPAVVRFPIDVPEDAKLAFGCGIDARRGWRLGGDGMRFAVAIDGERIWERSLYAPQLKRDRGWKDERLDLSPWAGRTIELELHTEPLESVDHDVGGFAVPRVETSRPVRRLTADEAPTVIVVVVDTLRADSLGAYGNTAGLSPNLDAMARAGHLFLAARSPSSWTWPATASVLTGLDVNRHGVRSSNASWLGHGHVTLAEVFASRGYTTGAFVTNVLIGRIDNFDQGFETFVHVPFARARAVNDRLEAWLDDTEGLARFVYLHYFDPHTPYLAPDGWAPQDAVKVDEASLAERLREARRAGEPTEALEATWAHRLRPRYDAEVRYFDAAFGELLDRLEERGILDDCLVVFTSDHGEEFLEHGQLGHGHHLYDETLWVPLWITGYGRQRLEPRAVKTAVSTKEILPTLCSVLGVDAPPALGRRPARDLLGRIPHHPVYAQSFHGIEEGVPGFTEKRSATDGRRKIIVTPATGRIEVYDLLADPGERHDLGAGAAPAMRRRLERWAQASVRPSGRTGNRERTDEWLRALGYIGR